MSIEQALTTVFGRIGAASYINVLDWNQYEYVGIIKVKQWYSTPSLKSQSTLNLIFCSISLSDLTTVWSALISHQFSVTNKACTLDVISSSANLISLAN